MKKTILLTLLLIFSVFLLFSDIPIRQEQLIYSILGFNGRDYSATFCGEDSDTIYLIADQNNFLSVRKTFVYYWPITQELKTDTRSLNIEFTGSLKLMKKDLEDEMLPISSYTYYNVKGKYEFNWMAATGRKAEAVFQGYQDMVKAYYFATDEYHEKLAAYKQFMDDMTLQLTILNAEGKDTSQQLNQLQSIPMPVPPEPSQDFIVPPVSPRNGFLLNLPEGEYNILFVNEDGTVMEGSKKKIVVFGNKRKGTVGLEVIPGDKWTRPVESATPSAVLYVDGSSDLYLRSYLQNEYNDLYYEKMRRNDARGNPDLLKWVRIQQLPDASLELKEQNGSMEILLEQSFSIEQIKGSALGYTIIPYDPEGKYKDKEPGLKAFHVPVQTGSEVFSLQMLDENGNYINGGDRQIRIVSLPKWDFILLVFVIAPLIVFLFIKIRRIRSTRKSKCV